MGVDYREQYKPEHLEPFFPNEIVKMLIVVLCTLAVLMFLVILPTLFDAAGLEGFFHSDQPADPSVTPPHIRPEWYFLAVYQYLKLMPSELFGIDGKALGILSQSVVIGMVIFLPFWFPLKAAGLDVGCRGRGLRCFGLFLGMFFVPTMGLVWVRSTLPEGYRDFLHPMFLWPVFAIGAYIAAGVIGRQCGFTDAFKWLKVYMVGLLLIGLQYLAFIVVFGQGLSWALPPKLAYLIGAIPFLVTSGYIIRFIRLRIRGNDDVSRVKLLYAFVTEGILLFMGLTIWAMWPHGGLYTTEHGWHHEARSFLFSIAVISAASIILIAFLSTERRTVRRTLSPEERDQIL